MQPIMLRGRINEEGELLVKIPTELPSGDVTVAIEYDHDDSEQVSSMTRAQFMEWLKNTPPPEPWGEDGSENAAQYIHNLRHQSAIRLDE